MIQKVIRLAQFQSPTKLDWIIYFAAFTLVQIPAIINFYYNDGDNNAYTLFAQSILNGQLELPVMDNYGDMAYYNGKYYLPYPPLPALILVPFVAFLGPDMVNTVAIATLMACISFYVLYKIFLKLNIKQEYFFWLFLGFFFGTGYWLAIFNSHHNYSFAHITSCLFQLLLINEILGKRRWWLIGLFIGCSFLTRQFTFLYVVFGLGYILYLHKQQKAIRLKDLVLFFAPIGFFVAAYLIYNYGRFGNFLDPGYNYIIYLGILQDRVEAYGVFNTRYFLYNLYCFFIKGFNIEFEGKSHLTIKDMDLWGTSLLSASPFLIISFKAALPRIIKVSSWLTVCLILFGQLFYHNNGWHQINTSRFSLDFLPLLIVMAALGVESIPKWLLKGMILYSVLLNVIGFLIHLLYQ